MRAFVLFIVFGFFCFSGFGQVTKQQDSLLQAKILEHINALRVKKKRKVLQYSLILEKASVLQNNYVVKKKRLSHSQCNVKLRNVRKRVDVVGGDHFFGVGENILYTVEHQFPITNDEVENLAEEIFLLWKNSKSHYRNMIEARFTDIGLAYQINKNTGRVYATTVFGSK